MVSLRMWSSIGSTSASMAIDIEALACEVRLAGSPRQIAAIIESLTNPPAGSAHVNRREV